MRSNTSNQSYGQFYSNGKKPDPKAPYTGVNPYPIRDYTTSTFKTTTTTEPVSMKDSDRPRADKDSKLYKGFGHLLPKKRSSSGLFNLGNTCYMYMILN